MSPRAVTARTARGPSRRSAARARTDAPRATLGASAASICVAAVALALPLAMLAGATSPYLDPKAWALHVLVAAAVLAWVYHASLGTDVLPAAAVGDTATRVLRWAVLAYGAWWIVATAASFTLGPSLWGNFGRADGLLTRLTAVALYFLVQSKFRSPLAALSLTDLLLLGSIPVVALALGQALRWDPMPAAGDPLTRVRSTFGQHVLLGGYLVLVIPLVAARLVGWRTDPAPGRTGGSGHSHRPWLVAAVWVVGALAILVVGSQWSPVWWLCLPWAAAGAVAWTAWGGVPGAGRPGRAAVLAAILIAQLAVVILSGARAAFLATLVGVSVAVGTMMLRARAWRRIAVAAAVLGAVIVVLALINVRGSPLRKLTVTGPTAIGRLATLADVERGSGRFRVRLWGSIVTAWTAQLRGHEVIPGVFPRLRSAIGYGPESQLATLDQFNPSRARSSKVWMDRAHNELLDHLVIGGLVGAALWLIVLVAIVVGGVRRLLTSASPLETTLRAGCLGAVVAHVVDAQFGVASPMSRAVFWVVAALLTMPLAAEAAPPQKSRAPSTPRSLRIAAVTAIAILAVVVAGASTRWLMASVAYADGSRRLSEGQLAAARQEFQRASRLVPGLSQPLDAVVGVTFNLAARESDVARQGALLGETEDALSELRRYSRYASNGANHWALVGQIALARVRAGEAPKLRTALEAYERAARLKPDDAWILGNWGIAWLDAREPARARDVAERAVALQPDAWLAWAVLARAAHQLGDASRAQEAAARARALTPVGGYSLLHELLP